MQNMKFYYCGCYFTHNIYIKEYDFHFRYLNDNDFYKEYNHILISMDCDNESKRLNLLRKIADEISRRKNKEKTDVERKNYLKKHYKPSDKDIYYLKNEFFQPSFLELIEEAKNSNHDKVKKLLDVISFEKQVYSFPIFTEEFCQRFLKEIEYFNKSDMPKERPNTMNKNGVLLDDIGFHDNFTANLRENFLDPLVQILFPDWRGQKLDSHKVFTVQYTDLEGESDLGYHYDNSEVTLNVCMGKNFTGGEIYFCDMNSVKLTESTCILVPQRIGYGLLHRGRQTHGTLKVTSGERHNIIMWMRASSVRNELCPMCNSKPDLLPASDYGDGFTLDEDEKKNICVSS